MTVPEAALLLGCSVSAVRRRIREGKLGHRRIGCMKQDNVRVDPEHIEAYLDGLGVGERERADMRGETREGLWWKGWGSG